MDCHIHHVPSHGCNTCRLCTYPCVSMRLWHVLSLVWKRGAAVSFHVPLSYCAMCRLLVRQRVAFSFCHVRLSGCDTWCRRGNFLFDLVSPRGSDTSRIPIGPRVVFGFTRVRFLFDHASVSDHYASETCPLGPLHVDVCTYPFHHRTNEMSLLFREISVIIQREYTTTNKVTTK